MFLSISELFAKRFLIGFALLISILQYFVQSGNFTEDLERSYQSRFYRLRSSEITFTPPKKIYLVTIDDESLDFFSKEVFHRRLSRSPVDRELLAKIIRLLEKQHPKTVGLNILLGQKGFGEEDQILAEAMKNSKNLILRENRSTPPLKIFRRVAKSGGGLAFQSNSDETLESICWNAQTCGSERFFHTELLKSWGQSGASPATRNGWARLHFFRTADYGKVERVELAQTQTVFSAKELYHLREKHFEEGALVIIGVGFEDLYKTYKSPFYIHQNERLFEIQVIAQAIENKLSGKWIVSAPPVLVSGVLLLLLLSLIFLNDKSKPILFGFVLLFYDISWSMTAMLLFNLHFISIPTILPVFMIFFFGLILILYQRIDDFVTKLQLTADLYKTRYEALNRELNTHHLFNELSRIQFMISRNPDAAKRYLICFNELLRSSLRYARDRKLYPAAKQLEHMETYIEQQKIFYGDRLKFNLEISGDWSKEELPWNVFYPLLENSVKYGETLLNQKKRDEITIDIMVRFEQNEVVFSICNPYQPGIEVASTGKGLQNLKERLIIFYPTGTASLQQEPKENLWTTTLSLPAKNRDTCFF